MSPQVTAEDIGWCWPRVVPGPPCDVPKSGTGRAAGGTILQDLELQCPPSRRAGAERVPVPRAALGTSPCSGNPTVGAGQGRAQQRAPALLPRVRTHGRAGCSRETLTASRLNQQQPLNVLGIFHQQQAKQAADLANALIISSLCQEKGILQKNPHPSPKNIMQTNSNSATPQGEGRLLTETNYYTQHHGTETPVPD